MKEKQGESAGRSGDIKKNGNQENEKKII